MMVARDWLAPGVALLTLQDPERLNAMGLEMAQAFRGRVEELKSESGLRVVVITGEGRAFSAGGVLQMLKAKPSLSFEENRRQMLDFYRSFLGVLELEVPVVAAVNGLAVGAGFCLACACDLRLADPRARFSAPFLRLGLFPGMGGSYFIPRVAGGRSSDLLLTGCSLDAREALQLGMVARLSPLGEVLPLAARVAAELALAAPLASRDMLRSLRGSGQQLQAALQREAEAQARCYAREEFREGVEAALEKRKPRFGTP